MLRVVVLAFATCVTTTWLSQCCCCCVHVRVGEHGGEVVALLLVVDAAVLVQRLEHERVQVAHAEGERTRPRAHLPIELVEESRRSVLSCVAERYVAQLGADEHRDHGGREEADDGEHDEANVLLGRAQHVDKRDVHVGVGVAGGSRGALVVQAHALHAHHEEEESAKDEEQAAVDGDAQEEQEGAMVAQADAPVDEYAVVVELGTADVAQLAVARRQRLDNQARLAEVELRQRMRRARVGARVARLRQPANWVLARVGRIGRRRPIELDEVAHVVARAVRFADALARQARIVRHQRVEHVDVDEEEHARGQVEEARDVEAVDQVSAEELQVVDVEADDEAELERILNSSMFDWFCSANE